MYSFRIIFIFLLLVKPVVAVSRWDNLIIPFLFNFLPSFLTLNPNVCIHRDNRFRHWLQCNKCGGCLALTYNCSKIYPGNFNEFYLSALKCNPGYLSVCGSTAALCFINAFAGTGLAIAYLSANRVQLDANRVQIENQPIIRQPIGNQPIIRQLGANQDLKTLEGFLTQAPDSEHEPRPCQICLERFPNIELECKHTMCKECCVHMVKIMNTLKCQCGIDSANPDNMRILYNP